MTALVGLLGMLLGCLAYSTIASCMSEKIEVYVRNVVGLNIQGMQRPAADHWCSDAPVGREEKVMPEKDRAFVAVAEEFAKDRGLQVEVCDVCTVRGKLKARLKGIRQTPAIVVGKSRIEGEFDTELLRKELESCLGR